MTVNFVKRINQIVDSKIKRFHQKFQEIKHNVNQIIPGGISILQQQKGKSINEFSGFNTFLEQIDSIRDKILKEVQEQQTQVENRLLQKKDNILKQIQDQRPKISLYESLPEKFRQKVLAKAQIEFKDKIKENQIRMSNKCDESFNQDLNKFNDFFDQINPESSLSDLVVKSVERMAKNLTGNSKFSGFMGKIF